MIKMIDPYDVVPWDATSSSEPGVHVSHWQEQNERNYYSVCKQCLACIYHVVTLLALCAVVFAMLKQVVRW